MDLDELIILTALRYASSSAFSLILRRSQDLRNLSARHSVNTTDDEKKERERNIQDLREEWQRAVGDSRSDPRALDILLCNLYPSAFAIVRKTSWHQVNRIQSVYSERSEVYLERIASGNMPQFGVRDQAAIKALFEIAENKNLESFSDRFTDSREFAELVVFFDASYSRLISLPQRLGVSSLMIRDMSRKAGRRRIEEYPVHDLFSQWQHRAEQDSEEFRQWAEKEIVNFIPQNLSHATELYFDFVRDPYLSIQTQAAIRQQVVAAAKERLSSLSPDEFARCFPSNLPYVLGYLIRLDRKPYPPEFQTRHSDWVWMRDILLEAARSNPRTLVPQLINEFGEYGPTGDVFTSYQFRRDAVEEMFGERAEELYKLIQKPFELDDEIDSNFARVVEMARQKANEMERARRVEEASAD